MLLLVASCAGDTAAVPNVVGEKEDYARGLLVGRGLVAEVIEERVADVPEGQVLTVAPEAGS